MKDKKEIESLKARQAELAREQQMLAERIDRLENPFTPGWYIVGAKDDISLEYYETGKALARVVKYWDAVPLTLETISPYLPKKTRYNWPEIIKKYPEAQWASTDEDGRKDYWNGKPEKRICSWGGAYRCGTDDSGSDAPDWADSLEQRPDNL